MSYYVNEIELKRQRDEIEELRNKINEIEKTNFFLIAKRRSNGYNKKSYNSFNRKSNVGANRKILNDINKLRMENQILQSKLNEKEDLLKKFQEVSAEATNKMGKMLQVNSFLREELGNLKRKSPITANVTSSQVYNSGYNDNFKVYNSGYNDNFKEIQTRYNNEINHNNLKIKEMKSKNELLANKLNEYASTNKELMIQNEIIKIPLNNSLYKSSKSRNRSILNSDYPEKHFYSFEPQFTAKRNSSKIEFKFH